MRKLFRFFTLMVGVGGMIYLISLSAKITLDDPLQIAESISLTEQETAWLAKNPTIRIAFDGNFPPYSFLDENKQLNGIAYDTLQIIGKKLGIRWQVDERYLWKDIYQAALDREVDVVATMVERPEREEHFLFTQPFIYKSLVIITHKNNRNIVGREDLANKTITLVSEYQYSRQVLDEFPDVIPFYVNDMRNALVAVETELADAAILYLAAGIYLQKQYHFSQIKFAGHYDQKTSNESIAIRNDWPLLASILQKGLNALTESEKQTIDKQWLTRLTVPVDYTVISQITLAAIAIVGILLFWLWQTRQKNIKIKRAKANLQNANQELYQLKENLEQEVNKRTGQLVTSEKKYRSLVESLKEEYFFYQHDTNRVFTYASPSLTAILGYSMEEFIGQAINFFTDHSDNKFAYAKTNRCLRGEKVPSFEVEVYDKNKNKRRLKILETPLYDDEGEIVGVEGIAQDITLLKQAQEQLNWLSYYDDLTGLANRRLFLIQFDHLIDLARRTNESIALLFLDVDRFKSVNDNLGHLMGDEVLKQTANRMRDLIRESDIAARVGGDEFTMILPDTDANGAEVVAKKLLKLQEMPFLLDDQEITLSTSIGIAIFPMDGTDALTLIKQADTAMYAAKRKKDGFSFCSADQLEINNRNLILEQSLRQALIKNRFDDAFELKVVYQAKTELDKGDVVGYEALIRWTHSELGSISPLEFIAIAEETGLIKELSIWVVTRVCKQTTEWHQAGFDFGSIAVNISALDLADNQFAQSMLDLIEQHGAKTQWLEFEVTESALMRSQEIAFENLAQLVECGVEISIDDFGTGYSSLAYLKNIPAHYLKIDRSFINNLMLCDEDQAVVQAVIAMAHAMGRKVIAEGVETAEQLAFLKSRNCDFGQGYLFAKPLPPAEVTATRMAKI